MEPMVKSESWHLGIHFGDPGHDQKHKDIQDGWKSTGAIGGDIPKMTSFLKGFKQASLGMYDKQGSALSDSWLLKPYPKLGFHYTGWFPTFSHT